MWLFFLSWIDVLVKVFFVCSKHQHTNVNNFCENLSQIQHQFFIYSYVLIFFCWKFISNTSSIIEKYSHILWYMYDEHFCDKKSLRLSFSKINYKSIFAMTKFLQSLFENLLCFAFVNFAMYVIYDISCYEHLF